MLEVFLFITGYAPSQKRFDTEEQYRVWLKELKPAASSKCAGVYVALKAERSFESGLLYTEAV